MKMSPLCATLALMSVVQCASAKDEWRELCAGMATAAEGSMDSRQTGMAMSQLMDLAKDNKPLQDIIIEAYESPRYSTEPMQKKAIEDFRDKWYVSCVRQYRPK